MEPEFERRSPGNESAPLKRTPLASEWWSNNDHDIYSYGKLLLLRPVAHNKTAYAGIGWMAFSEDSFE